MAHQTRRYSAGTKSCCISRVRTEAVSEEAAFSFVLIAWWEGRAAWYVIYMSATFSEPRQVVLQLGLREGMKVADLGAGSGHYSAAAAAIVNPGGKVYAVEILEDLHKYIKEQVHERHQHAVEPVWGDIERLGGTRLRDQSIDAAILANVLFQVENRFGVLAELKRIVKPGAKLLVVDWAGPYGGMGPVAERVVPERDAEDLFINGGFHKERNLRAGPHHYGIIFTAPL